MTPRWMTEADVRASLNPLELIDAMEEALGAFSAGEVAHPVRTAIETGGRSFFASMPAFYERRGILGAKLVTITPENAARGLHTHMAAISLFDSKTGELLAVMDGRYITEVRTAAVSAVSVRHLARANAETLAILGSGVQARSHAALMPGFRKIRAWSPTRVNLETFAAEVGAEVMESAEEAVRGADVVVVATNAVTPAILNGWVESGTHVIAMGACRPSQREVDPALTARARLIVDSRDAALRESGDIVMSIREGYFTEAHVGAELGEVVRGLKPGRTSDSEVTMFKSLGLAIEDLVAADIVYRNFSG